MTEEERGRLRFEYTKTVCNMAHLLRSSKKEDKQHILQKPDENSAMKFLPVQYTEQMSGCCGKRVRSWLNSATVTNSGEQT